MTIMNSTPWIAFFTLLIGFFTFLLWQATKNYTDVTKKLLEQSKEAFKQSRIAFLTDIFKDLVAYVKEQEKLNKPSIDYIFKMLVAFGKIDKEIAEEVWELMKTWAEGRTLGESMKKYDDSFRKELG